LRWKLVAVVGSHLELGIERGKTRRGAVKEGWVISGVDVKCGKARDTVVVELNYLSGLVPHLRGDDGRKIVTGCCWKKTRPIRIDLRLVVIG